ncbi:PREDICTED: uncharacterized protein LOC105561117 isoform X2 [Vollenhovia emeryi]|uniref:uncharacterized protein LOC105561117 isoform X2 n=1 Tax=Vollenhovia emeryi TaxID=411798 RepID=UPI0005F4C57C|nr:PREDICTED: uncharacterized protein LOC105561117 isoform X2 [Vollenhovia emeryi]
MAQNMPNQMEITTTPDGIKMYKCRKCSEISKRRYNLMRHFIRFHEKIMPRKSCCSIIFDTKSDFYKHKEEIHDEKKKYTKEQNQTSKQDDIRTETSMENTRVPLRSMANVNRTIVKRASKPRRKIKSSSKENLKIYNIMDTTKKGIIKRFQSIN